jgi:membrane protease YdiL (CAAX protease family)
MALSRLFFDETGIVRSGWRFVFFALAFIFLALITSPLTAQVFGFLPKPAFLFANGLALLISAVFVSWLCGRLFEKLPFRAVGISITAGWLRRFIIGLLIGSATLGLAVLVPLLSGQLTFSLRDANWWDVFGTFGSGLAIFAVFAAWEEVLFRGYPLQTFIRSRLALFGILFTAVLFAVTHVGNPRADILSWLNTFLAGIWFGLAYWRAGDLWMPFGMHFAWNWTQGAFFGIEVSGLTDIPSGSLLKEIDRGPRWLTGEGYGIEAGIASTAALIVSIIAIYFFLKRQSISRTGLQGTC